MSNVLRSIVFFFVYLLPVLGCWKLAFESLMHHHYLSAVITLLVAKVPIANWVVFIGGNW